MVNQQTLNYFKHAATNAIPLNFPFWEKNQGIIALRQIRAAMLNNSKTVAINGESLALAEAARRQMPHIAAMVKTLTGGLVGIALPKQMKQFLNGIIGRAAADQQYAQLVYDLFPVIADRYGFGKQASGKPRLSFARMIDDPDCKRLSR